MDETLKNVNKYYTDAINSIDKNELKKIIHEVNLLTTSPNKITIKEYITK
jgi:hypothetical protein